MMKKKQVNIINMPARHGKTIDSALRFYKELQKLPIDKLCGIARVGNGSFALTMQEVITKDKVRKLFEEHKKILRHYDNCNLEQDDTYHECIKVCDVLLELLGE